jgi:hypothetical protein
MTTATEILNNKASHQVNPGCPDGYIREFRPEGAEWADPNKHQLSGCDEILLTRMAEYLRDAVNGALDLSGALETRVYRETDNPENYRVQVVPSVGGPYVAIEYDSDDSSADIVGYWGDIAFCIREYGTAVAELCQELAE